MKTQARINGKMVNVCFGYRIGQNDFFSTWENMIRYWRPYYESRAELLEKARPEAVVETPKAQGDPSPARKRESSSKKQFL